MAFKHCSCPFRTSPQNICIVSASCAWGESTNNLILFSANIYQPRFFSMAQYPLQALRELWPCIDSGMETIITILSSYICFGKVILLFSLKVSTNSQHECHLYKRIGNLQCLVLINVSVLSVWTGLGLKGENEVLMTELRGRLSCEYFYEMQLLQKCILSISRRSVCSSWEHSDNLFLTGEENL